MKQEPKTLSVPVAGRLYFDLGKNASYEAASRGEIPVIRIGSRLRVPVVALEKMLEQAGSHIVPDHAGLPRPIPASNKMGRFLRLEHHPHPPIGEKGPPIDFEPHRTRNKFGEKSSARRNASGGVA